MTKLDLVQLATIVQTTPQILRQELAAWPKDVLRWHPTEGEWCVNQILGHFIEADRRGFDGRIRQILAEERPLLQAWDQPMVAAERQDCERDTTELLAELEAMRQESGRLIKKIQPEQLDRVGIHPQVGELSVRDLLNEWIYHDQAHHKQILSNVQAFVWPYMGNAQRFSEV